VKQRLAALLLVPLLVGAVLVTPLFFSEFQPAKSAGGGPAAVVVETVRLTTIYHSVSDTLQPRLLSEGYAASCQGTAFNGTAKSVAYSNQPVTCPSGGWTYVQDPTVHVVNQGIDCISYKMHGLSHAGSNAPCTVSEDSSTGNENVTYTYVSASGGATPAFTDTTCPATIETSDGYSVASGTVAAGAPSSGSATDTVSYTWTDATATVSSIDLACIGWSSTTTSTVYAEGQIGATTTNVGDTLETIWSFTYSSS
jgi:hypothetical protein